MEATYGNCFKSYSSKNHGDSVFGELNIQLGTLQKGSSFKKIFLECYKVFPELAAHSCYRNICSESLVKVQRNYLRQSLLL